VKFSAFTFKNKGKVLNFNSKFQKLKSEEKLCYLFLKSHHFKDNPITHACVVDGGNSVDLVGHSENQQ